MVKTESKIIFFQDEQEKVIFKTLAEILKKQIDQALDSNFIFSSDKKSSSRLYSAILQTHDKDELDQLKYEEV